MAAQFWTLVCVINEDNGIGRPWPILDSHNYKGGIDYFKIILKTNGLRDLYRGFGMSIITYAPSNALWWDSYFMIQRMVWSVLGYCNRNKENIK
eukprot:Gb_03233 [translate_table: standard]